MKGILNVMFDRHHYTHHHYPTDKLLQQIKDFIMPLIDDIKAKLDQANASIQKNTDLDQSILATLVADTQAIKDLKAALDAAIAAGDPARLQEVSDGMDALIAKSEAEALIKTNAITANTPAA